MLRERVKLRQGYRRKDLIKEMNPSSAGDFAAPLGRSKLSRQAKVDEKGGTLAVLRRKKVISVATIGCTMCSPHTVK